jgi:hypothetical protein
MAGEGLNKRLDLPPDAIVSARVEVVGWLSPDDAELKVSVLAAGETSNTQAIGMLEIAKADLLGALGSEDESQ